MFHTWYLWINRPHRKHQESGSWAPSRLLDKGPGHCNSGFYPPFTTEELCDLAESLALSGPWAPHMYNQRVCSKDFCRPCPSKEFMFHDKPVLRKPTQFAISSLPFGQEQGRTYWGKGSSRAWRFFFTAQKNKYFFQFLKRQSAR